MRHLTILTIVIGIFFSSSFTSIAPKSVKNKGAVTGRIIDKDGNSISKTDIKLYDMQGKLISSVFSDDDGVFMISDKKYGDYILKIHSKEGKTVEQEVTINKENTEFISKHIRNGIIQLKETVVEGKKVEKTL